MTTDILTDGFQLLRRIPVAELERRIAWLENSLASYRTMLVVRQLMDSKPEMLQTPPEWESVVGKSKPSQSAIESAMPQIALAAPLRSGSIAADVYDYMLTRRGRAVRITARHLLRTH